MKLNISRKLLFPGDHQDLAHSYHNLGLASNGMKCDERATVYHKLALEMIQRLFPDDHRYLANIYTKLGIAYSSMQDNNRAVEYYKQALEIGMCGIKNQSKSVMQL
jgi:tetratricopeptide (TPR) repeat protein